MRITVKSFGPEIVRLLGKVLVLDLKFGSTMDDLLSIIEDEIRLKFSISQGILDSGFTILVNGKQFSMPHRQHLKEGDVITILSPIGGG